MAWLVRQAGKPASQSQIPEHPRPPSIHPSIHPSLPPHATTAHNTQNHHARTLTLVVSVVCVGGMKPGRFITVLSAGLTKGAELTVRDTSCTGTGGTAAAAAAAGDAAAALPPPRLRLEGEAGATAAGGWQRACCGGRVKGNGT
jgi:hypothetical protein